MAKKDLHIQNVGVHLSNKTTIKLTAMTTIQPNTVITAVSICDSNCIYKAEVLSRKGDFVTLKVMGEIVRKKVKVGYDGNEYVMALGTYSMAPAFS